MIIHYSSVAHPDDYSDRIKEVISTPGYSKTVRAVTTATRREVFREYGITNAGPGDYEIDHLIPLSLGGSNSIKNLWPESYQTVLNAHVKDRLEDRLHALVVQGKIGFKTEFFPAQNFVLSENSIQTRTTTNGSAPQKWQQLGNRKFRSGL